VTFSEVADNVWVSDSQVVVVVSCKLSVCSEDFDSDAAVAKEECVPVGKPTGCIVVCECGCSDTVGWADIMTVTDVVNGWSETVEAVVANEASNVTVTEVSNVTATVLIDDANVSLLLENEALAWVEVTLP